MSVSRWISQAPEIAEAYDTTRPEFEAYVDEIETWYRTRPGTYAGLDETARLEGDAALAFRIALKIAESRRIIRELSAPVTITLLNPVYKETGRMQRREEHPHGEDSIRCKIRILRGLEALNPHLTARMIAIDDECPNESGAMADRILREYGEDCASGKYRALFLGEAIDRRDPELPPGLTHKDGPRRSVKGGALLFGMRVALKHGAEGLHLLIDNDADLSVHPAQIGILIEDIVGGRARAVAGSRREDDSVALIGPSRNTRGHLFIRVWQHWLPELARAITDTNRAFKAFESEALSKILPRIEIYTFPYQIELLQACISRGIPLNKRGIAYVDSEAASTQDGAEITETYLNQVHQIIDIARRYGELDEDDELARFFLGVSEAEWRRIEADPPDTLSELRQLARGR
ncbi:MAG: hypothetical protein JRF15_09575 [Deltaproteobacteria bacterium]|jgi:hypothetical protein|nr:hypothetical protein [Deltaproteobacteria bacterium]